MRDLSTNSESLRPLSVFLCHSSADKPTVRELYQRLRADGIDAWLDEEDLLPGQDWEYEIPKAVRNSDVVIVCLSRQSVNKAGYLQKEIKFALDTADKQPEGTIFIVPVKLEQCDVPDRLSRWQWVNLFAPNGYERLMRSLRLRAESLKATTPLTDESAPARATQPRQSNASEQSGGINVDADQVNIGKDAVGRDKIESAGGHIIHAEPGSTVIINEPSVSESVARKRHQEIDAERIAKEQAEQERLSREKAEADRLAKEKVEAERAEQLRLAREKAEAERLAKQKMETERVAKEKIEQDRLVLEKAEAERLAALKVEEERIAREARRAEQKQITQDRDQQEQLAKLKTKDEYQPASAPQKTNWLPLTMMLGAIAFIVLIAALTSRQAATPTPTQAPTAALIVVSPTMAVVSDTPQPTNTSESTATQTRVPPTIDPSLSIGSKQISDKDGMTLLYVPAGEFKMGAADTDAQAEPFEKPQHTVYLDAFWIDQTEVTNAMYVKCVEPGACQVPSSTRSNKHVSYYGNPQFDDYPVVYVDWNKAKQYCTWAGRDLPTEAQWEKAARGTDGRIYPWGNQTPDKTRLNYNSEVGDTTQVGAYPAGTSPYGALDMAGNVWEWVADWWSDWYNAVSPDRNPIGPTSGDYRVLRGGSLVDNATYVRASVRSGDVLGGRSAVEGFRCAMPAQ